VCGGQGPDGEEDGQQALAHVRFIGSDSDAFR
jgi:hypothetical protein